MTLKGLLAELNWYKTGTTERSWKKQKPNIAYTNDYLDVLRIDSSNAWVDDASMTKMWSIIFDYKKSFSSLETYKALEKVLNVRITPVTKGALKGYYGLRIYDMKVDPNDYIVKAILDYIFCGSI